MDSSAHWFQDTEEGGIDLKKKEFLSQRGGRGGDCSTTGNNVSGT